MEKDKVQNQPPVQVYNEWDPLEEVILGTAVNFQIPEKDLSTQAVLLKNMESLDEVTTGRMPQNVIEETEEDLWELENQLKKLNITVRRPKEIDLSKKFSTPYWESDGYSIYCPRDLFLAIDDMVIESPGVHRARYFETFAYREILQEYMNAGAKWISAPKPCLKDEIYLHPEKKKFVLNNFEPVFDAANIMRMGYDILYQVSISGNESGAVWLQNILGPKFKVHVLPDVYAGTHLDDTIVPLRPGLVLLNPERMHPGKIPEVFDQWEIIWSPEPVDIGYTGANLCSTWIGMNLLSITPNLVIMDKNQTELIRLLEKHQIDVIPMQLRHSRTLAGGFHCVTLDVRRTGKLEKYS